MYGDSEDLIGRWFRANSDKRKDIFLATKFANRTLADGTFTIDSTPEYCLSACNNSLERLGVPFIDLFYCHRLDQKTPIELTIRAMVQLKEAGKIKYLGLSECSAESLRRAHAVHPITAVQMEYSPFALEIESPQFKLLETARELGVALVAYSPLGRGMLSGTLRSRADFGPGDLRAILPRFSEENFPKNLMVVDRIAEIARQKRITPAQLSLAWLLAQGDDIFPIPGTTRTERLFENVGALKVTLSKDEENAVRTECESSGISGGRYPEVFAKTCFADTQLLKK
ncbi:Aldo/keto reductase [Cadophora sp. DSE1049]|nr:Aldo/keto reductase [Cadophora sp. DSE1049]